MTSEALLALHQQKLIDAQNVADSILRHQEEFVGAMLQYRQRLKQHHAEREVHAKALAANLAREHALLALERRAFDVPPIELFAQLLCSMARVEIVVERITRETRILLPGTRRVVTLEASPVAVASPTARTGLGRIADRLVKILPRSNAHVFAYRVHCRASVVADSVGDFAHELARLLSLFVLYEAGIQECNDWRALDVIPLAAELQKITSMEFAHQETLESSDPAADAGSLLDASRIQETVLAQVARVLRDRAQQFIRNCRNPLPLVLPQAPEPPLPHPGEPPSFPRSCSGTLAYWKEPWEAHYLLEKLEQAPPGRGDILLGYYYSPLEQALLPMRLPRQQLHAHMHLTGATRSGKTTILAAIVAQLLRGSDEAGPWAQGRGEPPPVLVIDPKGDHALYNTVKTEAAKRGQRFRTFTATAALASDHIDIFGTVLQITTDADEIGGILARSLDLFHGPGYGKSHFGRDNANLIAKTAEQLGKAVREATADGLATLSFSTLIEKLRKMSGRGSGGASEAVNALEPLARMDRLKPRPGSAREEAIDLWRMVEDREVVYVYADQFGGIRNLDVMRLVLFLLNTVCQKRKEQARERRTYALVDEFKDILSTNLGSVISTAAGNGLSLILANQSVAQLRSGDIDVAAELASNVSVRLFLTADSEEDIDDIQRLSGESPQWFASIGVGQSRLAGTGQVSSTNWGHAESLHKGASSGFSRMWSHFHGSSSALNGNSTSEGDSEGHGVQQSQQSGTGVSDQKGGGESRSQQVSEADASNLSFNETPRPSIHINEVLDTSSRQLACFLWVRHDVANRDGFRGRLIPMQALRCLDEEEFRARDSTPWPRCEAEQPRVEAPSDKSRPAASGEPPKDPGPPVKTATDGLSENQAEHNNRLKALFESEVPPLVAARKSHE